MVTTVIASVSCLAFVATGARTGFFPAQLPAAGLAPRWRTLLVRAAQADDAETTSAVTTPKHAEAKLAASPGLWDSLAFSAPAPERINGQLAMVGFVAALAVEAARGDCLLAQASNGAGLAWFAYTPVTRRAVRGRRLRRCSRVRAQRAGTADAELGNGCLAMLGLVALAVIEYLNDAPFVDV